MGIFSKFSFQKDEFLEELGRRQESYQSLFNKLIQTVDDAPYARYVSGLPELEAGEYEIENRKLLKILKETQNKGLNFLALFVAFLQYAKADIYDRETKKAYWISTILHRKKIDSFPDHNAILHIIKELDMLDYSE